MARAEEKKAKKEKKKGSKAAGVGIIAALLLLGGGLGYSQFGSGSGGGADTTGPDKSATVQNDNQGQSQDTAVTPADQGQSEVPQTIVVKIAENSVTINGNAVADKEALKKYITEYNADSRSFVLEDENSILDAYNWVTEAFSELEVELTVKQ